MKIDDGKFEGANGLPTTGWEEGKLNRAELTPGEHILTITYREDGASIDKTGITTYLSGPSEFGKEAVNICDR
jgi:hypothetical protein